MTQTEWEWKGARWWKFDFHTHTPASDDYGEKHPDHARLRDRSPREWLLDFMRAEIDCVAVTDHNSGKWIDPLNTALRELKDEQPEGFRSLYLFPGVEISVHGGIHVLAIFDLTTETSNIDHLLGSIGFPLEHRGSGNAVTSKSLHEVVSRIDQVGGIAIPAHVDGDRGLFRSSSGKTLEQILDSEQVFAMEALNHNVKPPQLYRDKQCSWTVVLGSDAHHPYGESGQKFPGSQFTWVKMSSPSLEGLRLALLDGAASVRRSDACTEDPNQAPSMALESLFVKKAKYVGQPDSFSLDLNPWLNAVIGGRGTGKSTLVEFLRLALRRTGEIPQELKPEFNKYSTVSRVRDEIGLLKEDTEISAYYRKDGGRFRIQWREESGLEPIEEETLEGWQPAQGEIQQRFPVRIYSQKQIFHLANAPLGLLTIIDEAAEVGRRSWDEKWKIEESRFLSLQTRAREIESSLASEQRLRGELDDIKRKLAIFEETGHTEILRAFQKCSRQRRAVDIWEDSWAGIDDRIQKLASEIVPSPLRDSSFDSGSSGDRDLLKHAAEVVGRLTDVVDSLEGIAKQVTQVRAQWQRQRAGSQWNGSLEVATRAYQGLDARLAKSGAGKPAEYGQLVQRRQAIEESLRDLKDRRSQSQQLRDQAQQHRCKLQEMRRRLTERRVEFLKTVLVNNSHVQMNVVPLGAQENVESEFRRLVGKEREFKNDIGSPGSGGLLGELYPDPNGTCEPEKLDELKEKLKRVASGDNESHGMHKWFADHLKNLPPEAFDRIDLWYPEDSLAIFYRSPGSGKLRPIHEGSPGQKTAALLAFLLSYGDEPLVLDQPEDDLDNHLIYNLIVRQLRETKQRRQVLVVTHNANIVVNGDAELVVALKAKGGQTVKEAEGRLEDTDVRDTICEVMEGGKEALERRYRRIALEGHRV